MRNLMVVKMLTRQSRLHAEPLMLKLGVRRPEAVRVRVTSPPEQTAADTSSSSAAAAAAAAASCKGRQAAEAFFFNPKKSSRMSSFQISL
jgi:hypothetical protein